MTLRKLTRGADLDTRRTFLTGMAGSMLGVGAAATFGPRAVAQALTQDPQKPVGWDYRELSGNQKAVSHTMVTIASDDLRITRRDNGHSIG